LTNLKRWKMKIEQFEVWIANLDPRRGTEPGKTRPVVVVQTNLLNKAHHPSTLVCPVTTHIEPKASLLRVNMKQGTAGLEEPSSVMIDQLRAIDNARLVHKVGKLPSPVVEKLKQNIMLVMDLW
jgi:mRNA interferase MazF